MKINYLIIGVIFALILITIAVSINIYKNNIGGKAVLNENKINFNKNEILGKWNAVAEETREEEINDKVNGDFIIFYNDKTYYLKEYNYEEKGNYLIENNDIIFYQNEQEKQAYLSGNAMLNFAMINKVDKISLTLSFPLYPKIVYYTQDLE